MRSFFVKTDDGPTSQHYIHRGVPQGGVLSPTLFNLVLIGLVERIPSSVHISIYADDICVWTSGVIRPQVRARLQKAAISISAYLSEQGLEISPEKSALVAFTRKPMTAYAVSINGQNVCYARPHRFLGVIIDRDLCWSLHVASLKKRLTAISHLFKFLGGKTYISARYVAIIPDSISRVSAVQSTGADEHLQKQHTYTRKCSGSDTQNLSRTGTLRIKSGDHCHCKGSLFKHSHNLGGAYSTHYTPSSRPCPPPSLTSKRSAQCLLL